MTTLKVSVGSSDFLVRCNLAEASSPVMANYGDGWQDTQYQCADTSHRTSGLVAIATQLAIAAFECSENDTEISVV